VSPADLALSLRTSGEHVSLGSLDGLLALAGIRVESMRADRDGWHVLITRGTDLGRLAYEGSGSTMALALAAACEKAAS
jgi:hypothetical protein